MFMLLSPVHAHCCVGKSEPEQSLHPVCQFPEGRGQAEGRSPGGPVAEANSLCNLKAR